MYWSSKIWPVSFKYIHCGFVFCVVIVTVRFFFNGLVLVTFNCQIWILLNSFKHTHCRNCTNNKKNGPDSRYVFQYFLINSICSLRTIICYVQLYENIYILITLAFFLLFDKKNQKHIANFSNYELVTFSDAFLLMLRRFELLPKYKF